MAAQEGDEKGTVSASGNLHPNFSESPTRAEAKDGSGAALEKRRASWSQDKGHGGGLESGKDFFCLLSLILLPFLLPSLQ